MATTAAGNTVSFPKGTGRWIAPAVALCLALFACAIPARSDDLWIPGYWDLRRRPEKLEGSSVRVIRFLVDDEYPPFHYATPEGGLAGMSVDLARAICAELKIACTIQARRWDTLADSLAEGRGDAIIAAMRITPELRTRFRATAPWHRSPARFIARKADAGAETTAPAMAGRKVAVAAGSAHVAFLREQFPGVTLIEAASPDEALAKLRAGQADFAFGDGPSLSFWLNGAASAGCCAFAGGPYLDSRYFGEGVGILVRKDDMALKKTLDYALAAVAEKGVYAELYLKYFPIGFY
ncbi:transporter substrate-binding domain-containing protein [Terrarubrum flagellatum]|uniref:transporter substrate-binding domain-containing protein n=1 Tax=Terrirubrum flagellatum TaxID=2895980 RepID=UPI003144DED6